MTWCDLVFQFTRPVWYLAILLSARYYLSERFESTFGVWLLSITVLTCSYVLIRAFFRYILGLRHIGTLDELQLYDMSTNKTIITAVLYFDKFDADSMLDFMRARMLKH